MLRYEKKYVVQGIDPGFVDAVVITHPALFRRAYPDRQINNIYYDTPEFRCFAENMAGINKRHKFRIRWYGDLDAANKSPRLEFKYKQNDLGGKERFTVNGFILNEPPVLDRSVHAQLGMDLLIPVLANTYHRRYYISADGKFRLTIDRDLRFGSFLNRPCNLKLDMRQPGLIIELKYDREHDDAFNEITRFFPFRQSKNSKYVRGVQMTNS